MDRVRLMLLLIYLVLPIDLIPDFIPVLGYADDAIIVVLALRSVVRRAGQDALRRHWPGSDDGLVAVRRLAAVVTADDSFVDQVRALGVQHPLLDEGLAELAEWAAEGVKGEITIVVGGAERTSISIEDAVAEVLSRKDRGARLKDVCAAVATSTGHSKKALYDAVVDHRREHSD